MEPLHILYEDPHLVICCKPVGVLSEDGQAGRCMPELLREHYRSLGQKNPYIATVHRLAVDLVLLLAVGQPSDRKDHRRRAGP